MKGGKFSKVTIIVKKKKSGAERQKKIGKRSKGLGEDKGRGA